MAMSREPETNTTTTPDRSFLLPILLAVFSLCGILLVFLIGNLNANRNALPIEDTSTPFKYQLIGTEPGISTAELTLEPGLTEFPVENGNGSPSGPLGLVVTAQQGGVSGSNSNTSTSGNPSTGKTSTSSNVISTSSTQYTATPPIILINPGTGTKTPTSPGVIVYTVPPTNTPRPTVTLTLTRTKSATVTSGGAITNTPKTPVTGPTQVPLVAGTYDDSHPLLLYNGWDSITDSTAYQSTLHVSTIVGSTITFRFTGQQLRLKYQGSASFGVIRISIGGLNFDLDESNTTNEWVSALLALGTYDITIMHTSGGSVNIDAIIIPDYNTPTPTASVTLTPTGLNQ